MASRRQRMAAQKNIKKATKVAKQNRLKTFAEKNA